jgi:hypothetical protein
MFSFRKSKKASQPVKSASKQTGTTSQPVNTPKQLNRTPRNPALVTSISSSSDIASIRSSSNIDSDAHMADFCKKINEFLDGYPSKNKWAAACKETVKSMHNDTLNQLKAIDTALALTRLSAELHIMADNLAKNFKPLTNFLEIFKKQDVVEIKNNFSTFAKQLLAVTKEYEQFTAKRAIAKQTYELKSIECNELSKIKEKCEQIHLKLSDLPETNDADQQLVLKNIQRYNECNIKMAEEMDDFISKDSFDVEGKVINDMKVVLDYGLLAYKTIRESSANAEAKESKPGTSNTTPAQQVDNEKLAEARRKQGFHPSTSTSTSTSTSQPQQLRRQPSNK